MLKLYTAKFNAIVTGETIIAMKFLIPYSNIGSTDAITQLHTAHTTFETVQMIK